MYYIMVYCFSYHILHHCLLERIAFRVTRLDIRKFRKTYQIDSLPLTFPTLSFPFPFPPTTRAALTTRQRRKWLINVLELLIQLISQLHPHRANVFIRPIPSASYPGHLASLLVKVGYHLRLHLPRAFRTEWCLCVEAGAVDAADHRGATVGFGSVPAEHVLDPEWMPAIGSQDGN